MIAEPEYDSLFYVDIEFRDANTEEWYEARAMIDCGSQGSVANDNVSKAYLPTQLSKPTPTSMIMADGSSSSTGPITSYNPISLCIGGNEESYGLDIAPMSPSHDFLLGSPWLRRHNPTINFRENYMTFNYGYCRHHCSHYGKTVPLYPESKPIRRIPSSKPVPDESIQESISNQPSSSSKPVLDESIQEPISSQPSSSPKPVPDKSIQEPVSSQPSSITSPHPKKTNKKSKTRQRKPKTTQETLPAGMEVPRVMLVSAAGFAMACRRPETELFLVSTKRIETEKSTPGINEIDEDLSTVPTEYHDLGELFSKKKANELPARGPHDHKIPLTPDAKPYFGPIYKLSPIELETLSKYIEENLQKGFIRHSQSPYGAPVLFAKKKDGSLRLCVDYRGLNKVTIKNRYPLPLIGELLDRISRAKVLTKFDVRDGYNRVRIAAGEEEKTAFRCRYGLFEYTVMPFGLCNAPGTFQHYMNNTFREFLDKFLIIYLDDFLIYSDNIKEHRKHVRQVMERLLESGLYLKSSKCEFHKEEIEFLGFIVGKGCIQMDPAKVEAITSWPAPKSIHDVRMFLGLANFYRRFIKDFSKAALPITKLLKKENTSQKFEWTIEAQEAFSELRRAFTTAPILQNFDPESPAILEADASDFALGAVVSQKGKDGRVHPIAFYSRKFNPAEINYEIYDKEMLAIVDSMEHYRHYFEGLGHRTTIYSDHHNLLWFTETKVYNRRQVRWAEKLSKFDFIIVFRPGKEGGKPDALSRRPDYAEQALLQDRKMTFLHADQVDTTAIKGDIEKVQSAVRSIQLETGVNEQLRQSILDALPNDPKVGKLLRYLRDPMVMRDDETVRLLRPLAIDEDGLLLREGLVYIPNNDGIKLQVLQNCHDSKVAGHFGQEKTIELVSRDYYWPGMGRFIKEYVRTCDVCARNKAPRHRRHGLLQPLPIPAGPWQSVSMDFIVELPPSQGYNAVYVCVDRFTKMACFCPTTSDITAEGTARLYLQYVFKNHGLPKDIVSDRGSQFISKFTRTLLALCDIRGNRSTAFHPESDGQTERVNQTLEQYLRIYCDYHQDDWSQLLPLAEFVYNNAKNSSTGMSPFYANYGYHPRHTIKVRQQVGPTNPTAEALAERLKQVHQELIRHLELAQQAYKRHHDRHAQPSPDFKPGDLVWLNRTNIRSARPSAKLDAKRLGPFRILEIVGDSKLACRLELPPQMSIHPVFHVRLLEPYHPNRIQGRTQPPPPPEVIEEENEYEIGEILDSRIIRRKLQYLVHWKGYGEHERTWEPVEHMTHAQDEIAEFHQRYPQRPAPKDLPSTNPRRSSGA